LTGKTVSIPKRASRLAVPNPRRQPEKMLEAVANHSAQVVVDELAWIEDSKVVEIIAGKGVRVIATVHGSGSCQDVCVSVCVRGAYRS
jgi:stage III sporulation protein SpoIIIAA